MRGAGCGVRGAGCGVRGAGCGVRGGCGVHDPGDAAGRQVGGVAALLASLGGLGVALWRQHNGNRFSILIDNGPVGGDRGAGGGWDASVAAFKRQQAQLPVLAQAAQQAAAAGAVYGNGPVGLG